jgi:ABC-2 type transport system permease protein
MTSTAATLASTFRSRAPRPGRILALARRDYLLTRSYRFGFTVEIVFGVINLLVYYYISRTFTNVGTSQLQGAPSYFDFAAAGTIVAVVVGATTVAIGNRVREEQLTGTLEAVFMQPLSTPEVALGLVGVPFVFAIVRAFFYTAIAAVWLGLYVTQTSWTGVVLMLLLTGAAMAVLGIAVGAVVLVFKRGQFLMGVLVFAMGLVSGSVFPVSVLPGWLQPVGEVVPTRFAFDGFRNALFRGGSWNNDALGLLLFATVGLPVAIALFGAALSWSKRTGSLTKY